MQHKIKNLRGNISGGVLAAIISLPMALAFGVQSGLGAQAGIYTAIILGFVTGIIGGTKTLISDPTGPMTVVAATVVSLSISSTGNLENALPLIIGTFALASLFEFTFGILNFGKYVRFMPYPVVSSFMAGIGLIIISMQLFPMLGYDSPSNMISIISNIGSPLSDPNIPALTLCLLTLALIYIIPKINKKLPNILIAMVTATVISSCLGLDVPVIGSIPTSLPSLQLHHISMLTWSDLNLMIGPALMLGGLGVIDSLLTSVVADNLTNTKHNSKRTIIGQGLGNFAVAIFGGIPGAGATMGTVTNIKGGATTKSSAIIKAVSLLIIIFSLASSVQVIPMSVLAAVLLHVGISIIDFKGMATLHKIPKQDAAVWLIVLLVTLFDNLLNAVAIGFTLASVLFIGKLSTKMTTSQKKIRLKDLVDNNTIPNEVAKSIYVQHIEGPMFFGFANQFREFCSEMNNMLIVIIRMEGIPFMDQSGLLTLRDVAREWHTRGIQVYITGASSDIKLAMTSAGITPNIVSSEFCYDSFNDCTNEIQGRVSNTTETEYHSVLMDQSVLHNRKLQVA